MRPIHCGENATYHLTWKTFLLPLPQASCRHGNILISWWRWWWYYGTMVVYLHQRTCQTWRRETLVQEDLEVPAVPAVRHGPADPWVQ